MALLFTGQSAREECEVKSVPFDDIQLQQEGHR